MNTVKVQSRIIGPTNPNEQLPPVALELLNETLTVRELITETVREQIRELKLRRKLNATETRIILQRQYLNKRDIEKQANKGVVKLPEVQSDTELDESAAIHEALRAFNEQVFVIIVDGQQQNELEDVVTLSATSKITFIRLTPLVGG